MTIKLGIVMDPIQSIKIEKDSSFAMLLAAQDKGWEIYYMELPDLYLRQGQARASVRPLSVDRDSQCWYRFGESLDLDLAELDVVLMRKDPPVDSEFIFATHILSEAESRGLLVVNRTDSLRNCNEKIFATRFPQCCPPVLVSRDLTRLRAFHEEHQDVIFKPLDGMGGAAIFRVKQGDGNLGVILETLTGHGQHQIMAQKYLPDIRDGDKRILLIDGKPVEYGLSRIPSDGENRGNLAAGGRGEARPITEKERWICEQVGPELVRRGLIFVGIDVIGGFLTEINVTSPTCIQEIDRAYNTGIATQLMNVLENKLKQG